jgi:type VI secretion system secreted protein VgrG
VVAFLDGDPDRPLITGSVYNGEQLPPYLNQGLDPNHRHDPNLSGVKTCSTPGGRGFNEIRFDDTKGKEQLFLHAESAMDVQVGGSQRVTVGQDRHLRVEGKHIETVVGQKVTGVHGPSSLAAGGGYSVYVNKQHSLDVNGSYKEHMISRNTAVEGMMRTQAMDGYDVVSSTDHREYATDGHYSGAGQYYQVRAPKVHVKAYAEIVLSCGGSSIKITPGAIYIDAGQVKINSGAAADVSDFSMPEFPLAPESWEPELAAKADDSVSGLPSAPDAKLAPARPKREAPEPAEPPPDQPPEHGQQVPEPESWSDKPSGGGVAGGGYPSPGAGSKRP